MEDPQLLAARTVQRAWYREGLTEIANGLFLLVFSGWMYARRAFGSSASLITLALILLFGYGTRPLLNWIRRRYLIERLGYVQAKPIERRHQAMAALLGAVFVLALWLLHGALDTRWLVAIAGLFWGALQVWLSRLIGLPRLFLAGAATALAGLLLAWLGPELWVSMALLIGIGGAISVISGAAALARALR